MRDVISGVVSKWFNLQMDSAFGAISESRAVMRDSDNRQSTQPTGRRIGVPRRGKMPRLRGLAATGCSIQPFSLMKDQG